MKKFGVIVAMFAITCVLSLGNIKADSYLGFAGIKLPALNGTYTSGETKKVTYGVQKVKSFGAVDNLSGDDRAVMANLNIPTSFVNLVTGSYVDLNYINSSGEGIVASDKYKIQFKCKKSTLSTATLSAMWVLDPSLYPNLIN